MIPEPLDKQIERATRARDERHDWQLWGPTLIGTFIGGTMGLLTFALCSVLGLRPSRWLVMTIAGALVGFVGPLIAIRLARRYPGWLDVGTEGDD